MITQTIIDLKDGATPYIKEKMAALAPERMAKAIGPDLRESVRDHLKRNPKNKKGWPSTKFWEQAARSVDWSADGTQITISINKIGVRQRYYGGVIRAVAAKFLTIPISPQAYGHTVADFPGSFLINTPKGAYIVQYAGAIGKRGKANKSNSTLEFLFKLKKSVNQTEDRTIIPDSKAITSTAMNALTNYFNRVKQG